MKDYLSDIASRIGIEISELQLEQFQKYYNLLLEKNKVMNLTAITEERDVVIKHFIDSISILQYYSLQKIEKVIDIGTGAGFPGIPLAIMLPDVQFTLMDSLNKRISFLNEVIDYCDLKNVRTIHSRAEDLGRSEEYREKFDICVSRAVAPLPVLLEYCSPFVKKDGIFISYKAMLAEEEIRESKNAQKKLSCTLIRKITFQLESTEYQRTFLIFQKTEELDSKYPRQPGIPKKKPL